ncbi:MAG: phosphatidylserine decarboxylase family protein [Ignavibacteriae bacterium]|nr:phosphatidylserine decarboxylase family protein [Ignavibacteriota bacterium]
MSQYGTGVVLKSLFVEGVTLVLVFTFINTEWLRYMIVGALCIATILLLNFFRDPERSTPQGNNIVVSPADGKVVLVKVVFEPEYLNQEAVQVSIFMSPLNVHVNRLPVSGKVGYFKHVQGDYLVAFNEKSSERNEQTVIGIENNNGKILFKQIAGAVARRIVADLTLGQEVRMGERFGMIKFGSRVDVIMPNVIQLKVKLDDRVVGGETILATFS